MRPTQVAYVLRSIADGIDRSKNPDRQLVAADLQILMRRIAEDMEATGGEQVAADASDYVCTFGVRLNVNSQEDENKVQQAIQNLHKSADPNLLGKYVREWFHNLLFSADMGSFVFTPGEGDRPAEAKFLFKFTGAIAQKMTTSAAKSQYKEWEQRFRDLIEKAAKKKFGSAFVGITIGNPKVEIS